MLLSVTKGALLFGLSICSMQMQASETVRISSNETCAALHFDIHKQTHDVQDTFKTRLQISQFTASPGVDYCNYQKSSSFKCPEKIKAGHGVWRLKKQLKGGAYGEVYEVKSGSAVGVLKVGRVENDANETQDNCREMKDEVENFGKIVAALKDKGEYEEHSMCRDYLVEFTDTTPCVVQPDGIIPVKNAILMNAMTGDLDKYKEWSGTKLRPLGLEAECMREVIAKVAKGLRCMHIAGWAHLDVKDGNILVKYNERSNSCPQAVRLADFGSSKAIGDPKHGFHISYAMTDSWYIPMEMFSDFTASGRLDWCMFAFNFIDYEDEIQKKWDEHWKGDCGNFGPDGRPTRVVLTTPETVESAGKSTSFAEAKGAIRPSETPWTPRTPRTPRTSISYPRAPTVTTKLGGGAVRPPSLSLQSFSSQTSESSGQLPKPT